MLIKVKCKHYPTRNKFYPRCVESYINSEHVGFIGALDYDDPDVALEEAPLCCNVDVDGQTKKILFKNHDEYSKFIAYAVAGARSGQMNEGC